MVARQSCDKGVFVLTANAEHAVRDGGGGASVHRLHDAL